MKVLFMGLMALLTACSGRADTEAKSADDADDETAAMIAAKDAQIKKLTARVRVLKEVVRQNVTEANETSPGTDPETEPHTESGHGPELLPLADASVNRPSTPGAQLLAFVPSGPECGQSGPSVGYVDHDPTPDAMCDGKCIMVRNTTPDWMSVRTPGGERMLICGGWGAFQGIAQVPETGSSETISVAPGSKDGTRSAVTWINDPGSVTYVLEFWSSTLNGKLIKKGAHTFTAQFPYRNTRWGMVCNDYNC